MKKTFNHLTHYVREKSQLKSGLILGLLSVLSLAQIPGANAATTLSNTNFESGSIGSNWSSYGSWMVEANSGDLSIVTAPGGKGGRALKATMNRSENFSNVVNGSPRAELESKIKFDPNTDYQINWKTYLPSDFQFDTSTNREIISQIHQTSGSGSPPFELGLSGSQYYYDSSCFGSPRSFLSASGDKGKWVSWQLNYRPSTSSTNAVTKLYKNGQLVLNYVGANAYSSQGYFKIGLYKWGWKTAPTNVSTRTVYFDDVIISKGTSTDVPVASSIPAAPDNLAVTGVYKGSTSGNYYVNLKWSDNSNNESGFRIYQSINSTSNYKLVKTPGANSTSYGLNMGSAPVKGTYYYKVYAYNSSGQSQSSNSATANIS